MEETNLETVEKKPYGKKITLDKELWRYLIQVKYDNNFRNMSDTIWFFIKNQGAKNNGI